MTLSKNWFTKLTQFLIPQTCLCCDKFIESTEYICGDCDLAVYPIKAPYCPRCALPRETGEGVNALCARCISENRYFDKIFAAFEYEGNVKQIFSRAKYGRREDTIKALTRLALERDRLRLPDDLQDALWVSIPMHDKDIRERGFNSSRLILDVLKAANIAGTDHNLLKKTLPRVRGNSKLSREAFSKQAFQMRTPLAESIQTVVIVDDVMSSGATLSATAKCLKKAGVKNVVGVVLARNI